MLNIPTKADGVDTLSAAEFNSLNNELKNTIESSGQTLAGGDLFQIAKSLASYVSAGSFYTDSGSVNNYVLSPLGSFKTPNSYLDGMEVSFVVGTTNTSTSTINVNSLGSKALVDGSGNALTANHLISGTMVTAKYNLSADHFKVQLIPQATSTDSSPGRAILNGGHGIGRNPSTNTTANADTLTVPGMYSLSSSSTNIPSAVNGTLLVYTSSDTNNLSQEFNAHSTSQKWLRSRSAGTWSAWTDLRALASTTNPGLVEKATATELTNGTADKFPDAAEIVAKYGAPQSTTITGATLGGDYTGGSITIVRIGRVVTITGSLTHNSSSVPISANNVIPSWALPLGTDFAINVYDITTRVYRSGVNPVDESFSNIYRDWAGSLVALTSTNNISMTYITSA